jgi:lycopene beta-cyclase
MYRFDYIIIGAGCSGLSLAFEMNANNLFENKTCAIIDKRENFNRDKIWSYWGVDTHSFNDCLINKWNKFIVKNNNEEIILNCEDFEYQSIDSGKFYKKILDNLSTNQNVKFFLNKSIDRVYENNNEVTLHSGDEIFRSNLVFNSSLDNKSSLEHELFQHFYGCEIELDEPLNLPEYPVLMDFNCSQDNWVHFFYTLPMGAGKIFIESTWISDQKNFLTTRYLSEINSYINDNFNYKKKYQIKYSEMGSIPMHHYQNNIGNKKIIPIGTSANLTRKSTGYTFLNIQKSVKKIVSDILQNKIVNISNLNIKYNFLDNIFINVLLEKRSEMRNIFFNLFKKNKTKDIVNFLSNNSSLYEDFKIIFSMPKLIFIKKLLKL